MVTMVGLDYIVEHRDEDADKVRDRLYKDHMTFLDDWVITDSLDQLEKEGVWYRLFRIYAESSMQDQTWYQRLRRWQDYLWPLGYHVS